MEDVRLPKEVDFVRDVQQADLQVGLESDLTRSIIRDTSDDGRYGLEAEADSAWQVFLALPPQVQAFWPSGDSPSRHD